MDGRSVLDKRSYPLSMAKKVEQDVVAACKRSKGKFIDKDFPATTSSIGRRKAQGVVEWARVSEFLESPSLFIDGVEAGDVVQGALGDCWFLGAMSVVATRDDLLYPLFVSAHPEYGFYQLKFYKDGDWRVVRYALPYPWKNALSSHSFFP